MQHQELAARAALPQPALSKRLTGKVAFTEDELRRVAAALDMTVGELCDPPPVGQAAGNSGQYAVSPVPTPTRRARQQRAAGPTRGLRKRAAS